MAESVKCDFPSCRMALSKCAVCDWATRSHGAASTVGETPRTDAAYEEMAKHAMYSGDAEPVVELARQLERELAAMTLRCRAADRTANNALADRSSIGTPKKLRRWTMWVGAAGMMNPREDENGAYVLHSDLATPSARATSKEESYRKAFVVTLGAAIAGGWFNADPKMKARAVAYLHSAKLNDEELTVEKVLHDAMGLPTDVERAFVVTPDGGHADGKA